MKPILETDADFICGIQSPCFQTLTQDEIALVRESKTQVLFRKGDHLTKQGTFASYVLFVMKGLAEQYIEGDNNKSFNLSMLKPGDFIGLSSVFSKNTFDYSTVALTDCQVFLIEKESLIEIIRKNGSFGLGIMQRYCELNSTLFENLNTILYKQMNGRMADVLLYLNNFKTDYADIFELLGRKDIANFAGMTTENAVKILKSFEKEGLIELTNKDIILINQKNLKEISHRG
jgi:CRP/FNR family transcriptional regulator